MKIFKGNRIILDLIICICSLIGIISNFCLFKTPIGLLYYTIFSNLLCFVFYSISIIKKIFTEFKLTTNYIKFKGLVLVSLVCTFLIYNFFMVPTGQVHAYDGHFLASCFVHIITPILVVADCIVNGKSKMLKYSYILNWTVAITIYGIMVIIYQHLGGLFLEGLNYPYFNFNYVEYGYIYCFFMNFIIIIFYDIICLLIVLINRKVIRGGNKYE